ncbi:TPA: alpha-galactosidase [Clostridium perfringens]|uniref:alpha-galactosidase n=1 Tax=Clostridium perfringens TaxID=1502 RepID=UPI000BB52FE5|nr:alpha-galactosidase [Clostridium perfringens]ATD49722.1 alpha-galactosidase [Clostridium perfringens]MDK0577365.1 alpha-galactosidase [Clostridium perfringens]MDK0580307.1 alpha-galactosidase [Clostridium perfringens]MDK0585898.1 alpha-galactosidase [Clostridium perfringens]MDM0593507.1 alpha-galactosidase [Clostridium perfringens]
MPIIFHKELKEFHLYNKEISYIIHILPNGHVGNLYFGKKIDPYKTYNHLFEGIYRPLAAYVYEGDNKFSLQNTRQEYPTFGLSDFRKGAFLIKQENGSEISDFKYESHKIIEGKLKLKGLPQTYVENKEDATTLEITLLDEVIKSKLKLYFTIFEDRAVITRSASFFNLSNKSINIEKAMSFNLDLPDSNYNMIQLNGAWGRERHVYDRSIKEGTQGFYSLKGASSAEFNPFLALRRPNTDEFSGEVIGFSLVYSGNFMAEIDVDTYNQTRIMMGIHPERFSWPLNLNEEFYTPEVVIVYSDKGLNYMSQVYHSLYRECLMRGKWKNSVRPILLNSWEALSFSIDEEKIKELATNASKLGVELFVLDDGWFGKRNNDNAGLGDWTVNKEKFPNGLNEIIEYINKLGMDFGIWIEPEMVNKDSELYRSHPDWIIHDPNRKPSHTRNQYTLDFSRDEVVDHIYNQIEKLLSDYNISYVKWDMNRYITECYSKDKGANLQGTVYHKYILNVYKLYDKLTTRFPNILFESCSSGGARFDPGMLYYAPQTWTSDNTDAMERIKIQYGSSLVYPLISMGSHVSESPNQQVFRETALETRANVAYFGNLGYELDVNKLSDVEKEEIKKQIQFYKENREVFQFGEFYRIKNPYNNNISAWMVKSNDEKTIILGCYKLLNHANEGKERVKLFGLDKDGDYKLSYPYEKEFKGDELMNVGISMNDDYFCNSGNDFSSVLYLLRKI